MAKILLIVAQAVIVLSSIVFGLFSIFVGFASGFANNSSDWATMLLGLAMVITAPGVFIQRIQNRTFWGLLLLAALILAKFLATEGEGEFTEWAEGYAIVMTAMGALYHFVKRQIIISRKAAR